VKNGRWTWTFLVAGTHFWVDFYANMRTPQLPFLALLWGLSNARLALLVSMQSMTANLLQPVFGYLTDRYPRKFSLGLGLLIIAVPMSLIYKAGSYPVFMAMVVVAGFGVALYHPLGASRVVEGSGKDKAVRMSVFSCLGSIGYAISPAVTVLMVAAGELKNLAVLLIPALLWVFLLFVFQRKRKETEISLDRRSPREKFNNIYLKPLLLLTCVIGMRSWLITSTSVFIPLWLVAQGASVKQAGLHLTFYLLAGSLGGLFCGYIYPQTGLRKLLIASFIAALFLLPLVLYTAGYIRIALLLALGFTLQGTIPVTVIAAQELMPSLAGFASGIAMGLAFGLGGLGTYLTGFWADSLGTVTALLLNSLILIPAMMIIIYITKEKIPGSRLKGEVYEN